MRQSTLWTIVIVAPLPGSGTDDPTRSQLFRPVDVARSFTECTYAARVEEAKAARHVDRPMAVLLPTRGPPR